MKSVITLFVSFIIPLLSFSQDVSENILEEKVGHLECKFEKNISDGDTFYMVLIMYQNAEYQHIIDYASVMLTDSIQLNELIADIDSAIVKMGDASNKGKSFTWRRKRYTMYKFASSNDSVAIYNKDEEYTYISKKVLIKLSNWLKTIEFPA